MDIIESLTKDVASKLIEHHQTDMKTFSVSAKTENRIEYIASMVSTPFHRVTFQQAKMIISENSQLPKVSFFPPFIKESSLGKVTRMVL